MSNFQRNTQVTDDLTAASEIGRAIVKHLREQRDKDDRLAVERAVSQQMMNDMGTTQHYRLEADGRIKSFLIGSRRVILTASIYDYLIAEAIRSHPAGQPPVRVDKPLARRWRERREALGVKEKQATQKARQGRAKNSAVQPPLGKPTPRLPPLA
jgi:hypothetical protein